MRKYVSECQYGCVLLCMIEKEQRMEVTLVSNDPNRDEKGRFVKGCSNAIRDNTPENQRKRSNGGKKSAVVRRARRKIRDALQDILAAPVISADEKMAKILKLYGIEDARQADALALSMILKAIDGDVEAAKFARDTTGEKPTTGVEVGNLDDKPFESINLGELSDEELQRMAFTRGAADEDSETE